MQDFEKAGSLRDREMELKSQIGAITAGAKEGEAAEQEAGEGSGPLVTDQDIANIVAQWTGIPIEKARARSCGELGDCKERQGSCSFLLLLRLIVMPVEGCGLLYASTMPNRLGFAGQQLTALANFTFSSGFTWCDECF